MSSGLTIVQASTCRTDLVGASFSLMTVRQCAVTFLPNMELSFATERPTEFGLSFSQVCTTAKTKEALEDVNSGRGFLRNIMNAMWGSSVPRFEWERDHWDTFRPRAIRPLDSPDLVDSHLNIENAAKTAMPGSEEALRFAQRLGIGRFVPCFLLFTDVGDLSIHLFPIGRQAPSEIYERLRSWIDSFYEINHAAIDQWARLEETIEAALEKVRLSLAAVQVWKHERKQSWQHLRRVSHYLFRLERHVLDLNVLTELAHDDDVPSSVHAEAKAFLNRLERLNKLDGQTWRLCEWIERVRFSKNPKQTIKDHFRFLGSRSRRSHFTNSDSDDFSDLSQRLAVAPGADRRFESGIDLFNPPELALGRWWRTESGRPLSKSRYERARKSWASYSKLKYGDTANGNVASILRTEYALVSLTALEQEVTGVPESAAQTVLDALRSYFSVPPHAEMEWLEITASYREALIVYFRNLKNHAPTWIIGLGAQMSPTLRWKDCIPHSTIGASRAEGVLQQLAELPRLAKLVHTVNAEMDEWLSSTKVRAADRESIWLGLTIAIGSARRQLEDIVFEGSNNAAHASYPGERFSREQMEKLFRLLDGHESAIKSLQFPFVGDRDVMRVSLPRPLDEILELTSEPTSSITERIRDALSTSAQQSVESAASWGSVRREASALNPVRKFCLVLEETLDANRLADVLPNEVVSRVSEISSGLAARPALASVLDRLKRPGVALH